MIVWKDIYVKLQERYEDVQASRVKDTTSGSGQYNGAV